MADYPIPSYRIPRRQAELPWRVIVVGLASALSVLAVGGLVWLASGQFTEREPAVIEADARPVKVRPADPGGMRISGTDDQIFERRGRTQGTLALTNGRLAPQAEAPDTDALRKQAGPFLLEAPAPAAAAAPPQPAAAAPEAPAVTAAPPAQSTPPAAALVSPARPVPSKRGSALVQFGALVSEEAARTEWARLAARMPDLFQGRSASITRFDREGKPPVWRLRTGGFANAAEARDLCEKAGAQGASCMVIGG